ncbi:hypothetical protein IE077_001887 [Cardiosporidium cionae]|uniref:Uncharacterized protein n=1 Tax=Cardiosporidium cionae TaxID=476202 RepID=A0ABQ7JGC6_9APIC|nr:hypothetical protein IE077_001887 [Cardiosporidium cionae]|eukprot:KAF8822930.1 hypothetical protein IE077_001887 [Cardiosporidium cionae]
MCQNFESRKATKTYDILRDEITRHIVQKKIRLKENFRDFDGLRRKRVSTSQFHRLLDQAGVHLSEAEFEEIAAKFEDECGDIRYVDFIREIDEASRRNCLSFQNIPTADLQQDKAKFVDSECLRRLHFLLHHVTTHGISLKHCYSDFDPLKRGSCTTGVFMRNFPLSFPYGKFSTEDVDTIVRNFRNADGDVLYRLLNDVLEGKVTLWCDGKAVGKLSWETVKSDYKTYPLEWSNQEAWLHLLKTHSLSSDMFSYPDFCRNLEERMARTRGETTQSTIQKIFDSNEKNLIPPETAARLNCLKQTMRKELKRRRQYLLSLCKDFDHKQSGTHAGYITSDQLSRVLSNSGLVVTAEEFELICDHYGKANEKDRLDYRKFCLDVEPPGFPQ